MIRPHPSRYRLGATPQLGVDSSRCVSDGGTGRQSTKHFPGHGQASPRPLGPELRRPPRSSLAAPLRRAPTMIPGGGSVGGPYRDRAATLSHRRRCGYQPRNGPSRLSFNRSSPHFGQDCCFPRSFAPSLCRTFAVLQRLRMAKRAAHDTSLGLMHMSLRNIEGGWMVLLATSSGAESSIKPEAPPITAASTQGSSSSFRQRRTDR